MANTSDTIQEELDGLDINTTNAWGEYPLDSVFVRTEQRGVSDVIKRIKNGRIDLNPEFQRDFVWPVDKMSRLIESCLMRIPLPVFYVAEAKDGRIIVVDGLQRLTTFYRFLDLDKKGDGFKLNLGNDSEQESYKLNGKKFKDLPLNLQERIEDTQLTVYILDAKAPERAKLDIFERVNGGVPLTRQQMRNCLYNGQATIWLREMANDELFLKVTGGSVTDDGSVTGGSLDRKKMRDREAINRFCAFRLLGEDAYKEVYKSDMDQFLAAALEKMNKLSESELDNLTQAFKSSLNHNYNLFDRHAFRKSIVNEDKFGSRAVINIALFDVCSVLFSQLEGISSRQVELRQAMIALLKYDEDFNQAISYSTNSTKQVLTRFKSARAAFQKVLTC